MAEIIYTSVVTHPSWYQCAVVVIDGISCSVHQGSPEKLMLHTCSSPMLMTPVHVSGLIPPSSCLMSSPVAGIQKSAKYSQQLTQHVASRRCPALSRDGHLAQSHPHSQPGQRGLPEREEQQREGHHRAGGGGCNGQPAGALWG